MSFEIILTKASFGNLGSSDRFVAVIKSHVRRYLSEKHDVTNAEQFVETCLSLHDPIITLISYIKRTSVRITSDAGWII